MRITLETHEDKYIIENPYDVCTVDVLLQYFLNIMLCAGFHHNSVQDAVLGKAEEYENNFKKEEER